jgi:hypothetical protein
MSPTEIEYDSTPQWSDDKSHWWDGQQWIPAQEAKAKANALAAISPEARPAYLPPADRASDRKAFVRRQLIIGGIVLAVLAAVLGIAVASRHGAPPLTPTQEVTKALVSASSAEHTKLVATKGFTGDFQALTSAGYEPQKGVALTIIRADRRSYCLKAVKGTVALYISADHETASPAVTPVPCT